MTKESRTRKSRTNPILDEVMISNVVEQALEIARKRAMILAQLKEALINEDQTRITELAKRLCGLGDDDAN